MYRIFEGPNGLYVALEREDGCHYQPPSWSSEAQLTLEQAERKLAELTDCLAEDDGTRDERYGW